MSQFAYPRLNVKGLVRINVGTANNDDYSSLFYKGNIPLRLSDSNDVEPETYNQADQEFIKWAQTPAPFSKTGSQLQRPNKDAGTAQAAVSADNQTATVIPAEWNYYGDMGVTFDSVTVVGVQLPGQLIESPTGHPWVGAELSFKNRPDNTGRSTGIMVDIDPEAVPSTQIFADNLMVQQNGTVIMNGKPTKASTRWINFQRNSVLSASAGASATFYCVVPVSQLQGQPIVDFFNQHSTRPIDGVMFRYNFFRTIPPINQNRYLGQAYFDKMVALYQVKGDNPGIAEIVGTVAPWYQGELTSVTMARQLLPVGSFPSPGGNGASFQLAPATLQVNGNSVSIDLVNVFPESYSGNYDPTLMGSNEKFDLGTLTLCLNTPQQVIGVINNTRAAYDPQGGLYDFPIPAQYASQVAQGNFLICSSKYPKSPLLQETEYMLATDTPTVYADQTAVGQLTKAFLYDGSQLPVTLSLYQKGSPCTTNVPSITVQQFKTDPNQATGGLAPINTYTNVQPGQPLALDISAFGVQIFNFALPGQTVSTLGDFNLNTTQLLNLRVFKEEDFSQYYVDPTSPQPVGNASLTFDVIYQNVFRNYYLLYPVMGQQVLPMNDPSYWEDPEMAGRLYQRISLDGWAKATYMPRTRDLSDSRRKLLQAWCLKILQGSTTTPTYS